MLDLAVTSWMTPKAQEKQRNWTSSKSNTCPPRTTQSEKVYPQSEGKHFQVINLVRIIPRKYTELLQLNNNRTQLKNKGLEQTLLHRRYTNGLWADKKMLKSKSLVIGKCKSDLPLDTTSYTFAWLVLKKSFGKDVQKLQPWFCKMVQPLSKTVWQLLKQTQNYIYIYIKELKAETQKHICTSCSQQQYL